MTDWKENDFESPVRQVYPKYLLAVFLTSQDFLCSRRKSFLYHVTFPVADRIVNQSELDVMRETLCSRAIVWLLS